MDATEYADSVICLSTTIWRRCRAWACPKRRRPPCCAACATRHAPVATASPRTAACCPGSSSVASAATAGELLADGSLPGRFLRRWAERPAWRQLQDVDGTWITSDELEARTRDGAQRLLAAGLTAGERILVSAGSSAALVVLYVAALRAGLVVVPMNTAYTQAEVARIVGDARPAAAALDDPERAAWVHAARAGVLEVPLDPATLPAARGAEPIDTVAGDAPALLMYTSGTTGRPKGALL